MCCISNKSCECSKTKNEMNVLEQTVCHAARGLHGEARITSRSGTQIGGGSAKVEWFPVETASESIQVANFRWRICLWVPTGV